MAGLEGVNAQSKQFDGVLERLQKHRQVSLQEKLFLHIDRTVYACGDMLWFKVYNADGTLHRPLDMSKVAYVELLDANQKPALQTKVALKGGTGNGAFQLPTTLQSGSYTVRAYTSWMKNFSPDFYFEQQVTIFNTFENLPKDESKKANGYAIQFFPESGHLLAGIDSKVAFKLVDQKSGKGAALKGKVYDQEGNQVADINSHKFGMGHFVFTPAQGKSYTATVTLPDSSTMIQPLPKVYEKGYALQLKELSDNRLQIVVQAVGRPDEQVYLLGHARQQVVVSESSTLREGITSFVIDQSALADGITHFTVFNTAQQPVCERLFFKQPMQGLALKLTAPKLQFNIREKVDLTLQTSTTHSAPANLSMAVYRLDSLQQQPDNHIASYFWLESDLKGVVQNPTYYFSEEGKADKLAMDNLMLTHGWSRFKWEEVLEKAPTAHQFLPEYDGHLLTGKVSHRVTGEAVPNVMTYMASPGRPIRFYNSKSDSQGLVRYELKDFYGNKDVIVQTDFSKDSTFHFELFSPFSDRYAVAKTPAFNLSESLTQDLTARHVEVQVQHAYHGHQQNRFKAPTIDSTAFYGQPSERYLLDDYKRFKVMEEVMREYVQGVQVRSRGRSFHFMVHNRPYKSIFRQNPMVLLDGVPVFSVDKIMAFDPLKVKQLDVIASRYFHGPLEYEGMVSYQTYTGDLAGFEPDARALMQSYEGLQLEREFYAPVYDTAEQKKSRLADFRNLLHWAPEIKLEAEKAGQISFYTSDQPGTYLVVVQGMTAAGEAGSQVLQIRVDGAVSRK